VLRNLIQNGRRHVAQPQPVTILDARAQARRHEHFVIYLNARRRAVQQRQAGRSTVDGSNTQLDT
jgi:hypothetical protein